MPAALASKDEIIDRLFTVFRDRGFDGASLADLSRATGLGKSSLYHHFPAGKEQMAEAVLGRAEALIENTILHVAQSPEPLKVRARKIVATLEHIYAGGRTSCVLGHLATAGIGTAAQQSLRRSFEQWIDAIAELARDAGMSPVRARNYAEDWVAQVQGALTLQAATGNTGSFQRTLTALLHLAKEDSVREKN
jgi:TetR/AcrR family transcriptional repressor of lmrAB and yxaGH operons